MNDRCHRDCRCQFGEDWPDVSWVLPNLAVGGMVHDWEIEELKELGVTHIINVNWPDRPEYPKVIESFAHLGLANLDNGEPKPVWWWQAGVDFASHLGPGDKLLIHCGHGINRGPAMTYAVLRSWGYADAEARLRAARPQTGGEVFETYRASADGAVRRG